MATGPVTLNRRSTDHDEPSNRDILDRLDAFIDEHRRDHVTLDNRLATHDTAAALRQAKVEGLADLKGDIACLRTEIGTLREFRVQVETLGKLTRWMTGGSMLAALAAISSFVIIITHLGAGQPP